MCVYIYLPPSNAITSRHIGNISEMLHETFRQVGSVTVQTRCCTWFTLLSSFPSSSFSASSPLIILPATPDSSLESLFGPYSSLDTSSETGSLFRSSRLLGCPESSWSCVPYCLLSPSRLRSCSPPPCSGWGFRLHCCCSHGPRSWLAGRWRPGWGEGGGSTSFCPEWLDQFACLSSLFARVYSMENSKASK